MSLRNRLGDWLTLPEIEAFVYECRSCDARFNDETETCPECGGEVSEVEPDPNLVYWGPMV